MGHISSLNSKLTACLVFQLYHTAPKNSIPFQKFLPRAYLQNYRHHKQKFAVEITHKGKPL